MCVKRANPQQNIIPIFRKILLYDLEKNKELGYRYELNPEYNDMRYLLKDFMDIIVASTMDNSMSIII